MTVSIAVVAYNEGTFLPLLLSDIALQDYPHNKIELLLIDSISSDNTPEIMRKFKEECDFLSCKLLVNKKRVIPAGHNLAIDNFIGDALIRIDAHARIPVDFISKNVKVLNGGEMAVGGRRPSIVSRSDHIGKLLLSAENSVFGSGFAPYRTSREKLYTNSLFCGMYRREVFEKAGRFNELLPRSEDNEMCYRIRRSGYRLCYSPEIVFFQYMRADLFSMLRQKLLNGFAVGKTLAVEPRCFSLFHFAPLFLILSLFVAVLLCLKGDFFPMLFLCSLYGTLLCAATVAAVFKEPVLCNLYLPLILFLVHWFYGIGTILGLIVMPFWLFFIKRNVI